MLEEHLITFSEAAAHLPRLNGRKIHSSSIWRWATKGVRGVRLECRRLGGRFVTSLEALDRFGKALAEVHTLQKGAKSVASTDEHSDKRGDVDCCGDTKHRDAGILGKRGHGAVE